MDQPEGLSRDRGAWALIPIPCKASFGLVAVGCALVMAACGGSGSHHYATRLRGLAQAVAYSSCMRSHRVPTFPDASADGGFDIPSTINPRSPAYVSARQPCTNLLPGPVATPTESDRDRLVLVASAKCLRSHGVQVADPTFSGPYITLDIPDQTTIQSPVFKRAEQAFHYRFPTAQMALPDRHRHQGRPPGSGSRARRRATVAPRDAIVGASRATGRPVEARALGDSAGR